jgi:membrane associated rhomboid family serine protease
MFPIRDDNPTLRTSVTTWAIIGMNVACWVFIQGLGSEGPLAESICRLGAIPAELLGTVPPGTRVPLGPRAVCVLEGTPHWSTLVTAMFMHGGWMHIIGNMWFLAIFGDNVEDSMGRIRFLAFYMLCGLAAGLTQVLVQPGSALPMVGASGAIGGVMGAYAILYPRAPVHMLIIIFFYFTRIIVPAWVLLGYWFLIQLFSGFGSLGAAGGGTAFWAHVGGFTAGVTLVFVFRNPELVEIHRRAMHRAQFTMDRDSGW